MSQTIHVETDSVRYVYMPLEDLYLVLITKKNSNIIEDIEILHQMQKIVLKIWNKGITEKQISKNAFDLILSFDDLITLNGYRDSVTMSQLEAYLEMDSTDEKMHKKMRMIREKEAKEIAKKQQKEIARKQKEESKTKKQLGIKEQDPMDSESTHMSTPISTKKYDEPKVETRAPTGKGMQLGKPKKLPGQSANIKDSLFKNDIFTQPEEVEEAPVKLDAQPKVDLKIQEMVMWDVSKFGDVEKLTVKGTVSFEVQDESKKVTQIDFVQPQSSLFKNFKIHPDVDKQAWKNRGVISAVDQESGFIAGNEIQALIYKHNSDDETQLPFELSIFTSKAAGGKIKVALEVEFTESSEGPNSNYSGINVGIKVEEEPKLLSIENSTTNYANGQILWTINDLNQEYTNATLQFHTKSAEETMFPLKMSYTHENTGDNTSQLFIRLLLV